MYNILYKQSSNTLKYTSDVLMYSTGHFYYSKMAIHRFVIAQVLYQQHRMVVLLELWIVMQSFKVIYIFHKLI